MDPGEIFPGSCKLIHLVSWTIPGCSRILQAGWISGTVLPYKLRYIVAFGLVEMSTNLKTTIYRNSYENTVPGLLAFSFVRIYPRIMMCDVSQARTRPRRTATNAGSNTGPKYSLSRRSHETTGLRSCYTYSMIFPFFVVHTSGRDHGLANAPAEAD